MVRPVRQNSRDAVKVCSMWHVVVAGEYARAVDDAGSESEKVPMEGEVQRPAPVRIGLTCGPVRGLAAMQRQLPTMVKGDAVFAVISFYWHWHSSSGVCLPYCKCHWQQFSTCECPSGHCPEGLGLCQWHLYLGNKERFKGSYYVSLRREHAAGVPAFVWWFV